MTTRLAGDATRFLPFNRGSDPGAVRCGAGNPQHPSGYCTGYFWQEVLERERFLDILGSYMFVEHREEKVEDAKGARTVEAGDRHLPALPSARLRQQAGLRRPRQTAPAATTSSSTLPAAARRTASPGCRTGSRACTTPMMRRSTTVSSS